MNKLKNQRSGACDQCLSGHIFLQSHLHVSK